MCKGADVVKDIRAKTVSINGKTAVYSLQGELKFTSHGRSLISAELQDLVYAYCSNA